MPFWPAKLQRSVPLIVYLHLTKVFCPILVVLLMPDRSGRLQASSSPLQSFYRSP